MAAAANWTDGEMRHLIPANWTVTDATTGHTGIRCDYTAGAIESFYQCAERLGHPRGMCYGNQRINGTSVCTCAIFGGWNVSCDEARCTYGTVDGCSARMPHHYFNVLLCAVAIIIAFIGNAYSFHVAWKGRAMCSPNVTNTTLVFMNLAAFSQTLWFVSVFLAQIVRNSVELMVRFCGGAEARGGARGGWGGPANFTPWPPLPPHPRTRPVYLSPCGPSDSFRKPFLHLASPPSHPPPPPPPPPTLPTARVLLRAPLTHITV